MEISVNTSLRKIMVASCLVAVLGGQALLAAPRDTSTIESASEVLDALAAIPLKGIPPSLLQDAQGVAVIPGVIKASFVIGGRHGKGVLLVREPNGFWSKPIFITLTGGSVGWQAGVQSTDLVLVFKTRNSLDGILKGKGKLTLGADVAVAAGPVGRQAEAGTDGQLKAEIYSYSRSRGLFAGVSLEGAALHMDSGATDSYYRTEAGSVLDPMTGRLIPLTPPSEKLRLKLGSMTPTMEPAPVFVPVPEPPPAPSGVVPPLPLPTPIVPPPPPPPQPK
jgi:lipid-binding SYLF domain-containing protein